MAIFIINNSSLEDVLALSAQSVPLLTSPGICASRSLPLRDSSQFCGVWRGGPQGWDRTHGGPIGQVPGIPRLEGKQSSSFSLN